MCFLDLNRLAWVAIVDNPGMLWDIFCKVIDNHGDLGVSWRLSCCLVDRGHQVRLWVDDPCALTWMAPQGRDGVEVKTWSQALDVSDLTAAEVIVETFGCDIASEVLAIYRARAEASGIKPVWINLEYLSAEPYVARNHGLESPVMHGPGRGLTRHFFYPGFTAGTGGLLREDCLLARQKAFDRNTWLHQQDVPCIQDKVGRPERLISLFCYEPPALQNLISQLAAQPLQTRLLVTAGRATEAVQLAVRSKNEREPLWNMRSALSISYLPYLSQDDYDHLLWSCDVNFVRGEDSLVRALWAGKPLVWQIYPQHDNAHHDKLKAFMQAIEAPQSLRAFHHAWNGVNTAPLVLPGELALQDWTDCVRSSRTQLLQQTDLLSQLLAFVAALQR
jgi:uncharacterized repeat protein (TIGR03837 family)